MNILSVTGILAFWCFTTSIAYAQDSELVELAGPESVFTQPQNLDVTVAGVNHQIPYYNVDGDAIFEGDIVLGTAEEIAFINLFAGADFERLEEEQDAAEGFGIPGDVFRSAVPRGLAIVEMWDGVRRRWNNRTVPYTVSAGLPDKSRVTKAIEHWVDNTDTVFVERTAGNQAQFPDFVEFVPGAGCSSAVGRQGGRQRIKLHSTCSIGNVIHEIGHAVGLGHEHTRSDRDQFVTVRMDLVQSGAEGNFGVNTAKYDDEGVYDYASIMHYTGDAFTKSPGQPTIVPRQSGVTIGQRRKLSDGDKAAVEIIYSN